jgi:hypothetical protein
MSWQRALTITFLVGLTLADTAASRAAGKPVVTEESDEEEEAETDTPCAAASGEKDPYGELRVTVTDLQARSGVSARTQRRLQKLASLLDARDAALQQGTCDTGGLDQQIESLAAGLGQELPAPAAPSRPTPSRPAVAAGDDSAEDAGSPATQPSPRSGKGLDLDDVSRAADVIAKLADIVQSFRSQSGRRRTADTGTESPSVLPPRPAPSSTGDRDEDDPAPTDAQADGRSPKRTLRMALKPQSRPESPAAADLGRSRTLRLAPPVPAASAAAAPAPKSTAQSPSRGLPGASPAGPRPATVTGRIVNERNEAVVGALVELSSAGTAQTDRLGRFSLKNVTPGRYRVVVSAPGLRPETRSIVLDAGEVESLEVMLRANQPLGKLPPGPHAPRR